MRAEIVSIGTEILLGEITDTNSSYLAGQLPSLGIDLHFISTVGDNQHRLIETLRHAWQRSDTIICTGGLGPTDDDITREAVAAFLNEQITTDPALVQEFKELFRRFNMDMPVSNLKQAGIIPSATILHNPRGTAPGWWVEKDGHIIATLPGPPGEMKIMWTSEVLPRLRRKSGGRPVIIARTLKTFGLSEAKVGEMVKPFLLAANPSVGIYARQDGVQLRIAAKATRVDEAAAAIDKTESEIRAILGNCIWGVDSDTLENLVSALMIDKGLSLATIECGTGGILANSITNSSLSTSYYRCGIAVEDASALAAFGIDSKILNEHGPVSNELAEEMASAVSRKANSSIGLALTGKLEMEDAQKERFGTIIIGIADAHGKCSIRRNYPGNRLQIKQRAATSALFELRKMLL